MDVLLSFGRVEQRNIVKVAPKVVLSVLMFLDRLVDCLGFSCANDERSFLL